MPSVSVVMPAYNHAHFLPRAAAGLQVLQGDNRGHIVATQSLVRELDIELFFSDMAELGAQLRGRARMVQLRSDMWRHRENFTVDYYVDELVNFFRQVIASSQVDGYR